MADVFPSTLASFFRGSSEIMDSVALWREYAKTLPLHAREAAADTAFPVKHRGYELSTCGATLLALFCMKVDEEGWLDNYSSSDVRYGDHLIPLPSVVSRFLADHFTRPEFDKYAIGNALGLVAGISESRGLVFDRKIAGYLMGL